MATAADVSSLLQTDNLDDAIAVMNGEVRNKPGSVELRATLAELLCISGNLERADTILDAISDLDPGAAVGVALIRQLVRAEQARQQFYTEGRVPEFVAKPDAHMEAVLRAAVALRTGSKDEAAALLRESESLRKPVAGKADGVDFDDFRDLDDLSAGHLEVLTSTGKYFWIPMDRIELIELRAPERRRDLLWRRAHVSVDDGPDGEVFLPCIYASPDSTAAHRLGHVTDYDGDPERCMLGRGLRTFLVGEHSQSILALKRIDLAHPA